MKKIILLSLFLLPLNAMATTISSKQASNFIDRKVTVCGKVAEISNFRGDTFINLDYPYPNQTIYFYSNHQFLSKKYLFKTICGTGVVKQHKGKLQIKISNISDLSFR